MSAATHFVPVAASENTIEPTVQNKLLRFYPEKVKYFLKKFANNHAIYEMDSAILRYTQPANVICSQFADDLYA